MVIRIFILAFAALACAAPAAEPEPAYRIEQIQHPKELSLEASGLAVLPGGKLAVAIRRGEIWILDNPYTASTPTAVTSPAVAGLTEPSPSSPRTGSTPQWHRFASGLHEPLGLSYRDGALYTTQRSEVTRIRDTDGDGVADEYLAAATGWGVSGAYHEYAYGPKFDPAGNMWVTLNCTMGEVTYRDQTQWRGYSLRVAPDGKWQPISGGMRSPSGIGINSAGDAFYTEQQGNWNCAGGIHHMQPGVFHGHQDSYRSALLPGAPFAKPQVIVEKVPVPEVRAKLPIYRPASVWLPYRKMGMSCTDLTLDSTGGKFGPFAGQFFIGEFTMSGINRVFMEKVNGEYQGACFPFLDGFQSGVLRMEFGDDGSMFVGETNRGWNSYGSRSYGLERVIWNGRTPFEIKTMEARPKGFRLTFTKPITGGAAKAAQFQFQSYTYEYHQAYGGLEMDAKDLAVTASKLSDDGLALDVELDSVRAGYIHELKVTGLKAKDGDALVHDFAYYTLNQVPAP